MPAFNVIFDLGGCLGGLKRKLGYEKEEHLVRFLESLTSRNLPEARRLVDEFKEELDAFARYKNSSEECREELVFGQVLDSLLCQYIETNPKLIADAMAEYFRPEMEQWM
jgi:hypothetical protein